MNNNINFSNGQVSDYNLSIQLDHQKVDETTTLMTYNDYELVLSGALTIFDKEEGYYYSGERVLDFIKNELQISEDTFFQWLEKNIKNEILDSRIDVESNPWFEWIDSNGECIVDVFDTFYQDESENINLLNDK